MRPQMGATILAKTYKLDKVCIALPRIELYSSISLTGSAQNRITNQ